MVSSRGAQRDLLISINRDFLINIFIFPHISISSDFPGDRSPYPLSTTGNGQRWGWGWGWACPYLRIVGFAQGEPRKGGKERTH